VSDEARARSFDTAAAAYERYRPEYPEEALRWVVDRLGLSPGSRVLDLGAGTGKLSRGLSALGLDVVAVEPGAAMLAELRAAVPGVEALQGAAEAIPLEDHSADAAFAGQAFHWFDRARVQPELQRVLRPRGGLGLLWNWEDVGDPIGARLAEVLGHDDGFYHDPPDPRYFEPVGETAFVTPIRVTPDTLTGWMGTTSQLLTADPREREELLERVRTAAQEFGEHFELSRLTYVYAYRAVS
jgi:SAM-dependent methyltransferase